MDPSNSVGFVHIKRIRLEDIRGLHQLDLDFGSGAGSDGAIRKKSVIIGRNGTGKSTVLRALAIALSPQSETISLLASGDTAFPVAIASIRTSSASAVVVLLRPAS